MSRRTVALVGNANVGKSTVFNEITGMKQHTGNWTGKTVDTASGEYYYKFNDYTLVDLPGTYSLLSSSEEERVARDFLIWNKVDCVVIVADSTNLLRNLNLVLQTLELTGNAVLLLNLWDEAAKRNIIIDKKKLSELLGIPVVSSTARSGKGVNELLEQVHKIVTGDCCPEQLRVKYVSPIEQAERRCEKGLSKHFKTDIDMRFLALRVLENDPSFNASLEKNLSGGFQDDFDVLKSREILSRFNFDGENYVQSVTASISQQAERIFSQSVKQLPSLEEKKQNMIDRVLLGRYTAVPAMLLLVGVVLWLTMVGANYPSSILKSAFDAAEAWLASHSLALGIPDVIVNMVVHGVLRVLFWVVAVMLPPMAIFFPLFALLEAYGVLPRIAFNLDRGFEKCGACGKQALTTCMAYGCNAVGVTGCRIIDSPRERLIAIITNSLTPCNGRFPLLIVIISMFFCDNSFAGAAVMLAFVLLSLAATMLSAKILSSTVLRGEKSAFVLELPPYRRPQFFKVIGETVKEKIVFVLLRAVVVAAPAGLLIWCLANIKAGGSSLLAYLADFLDPAGRFIGLDGVMLLAFILGFPANEIVIPIALMTYLASGNLGDYSSVDALKTILTDNGWTWVTALCAAVFSMFHFPCSTTLLTIWKETRSVKWTALSVIVPLALGVTVCAVLNFVLNYLIR